jgi:AsmA protein
VTSARGFKRLLIGFLAVIACGLLALLAAPLLISAKAARDAVVAEVRAVTGLEPTVRGMAAVSMFPTGTVNLDDVVLGGNELDPAFTTERLIAHLRFLPLLTGRIEIADVSLVRPRIMLAFEPNGQTNWASLIEALARALTPNAERADRVLSFSEIRINDGMIVLRDVGRNVTETLRNVDVSLAWPSISKSFAATGRFMWHDEPVDASFTIADFAAALSGGNSGLKFRLGAAPMKAAFEGAMSYLPNLKIDGTLAADAASLREAFHWFGDKPLPPGGLGRFALKSRITVTGGTAGLSGVNVELDGNAAEGVLTYTTAGRPTLQGTLAVDALDLTPYATAIRLMATNARDWNRKPIALDWANGLDLDLRFSAAKVTIASAKLGRTAVAVNLRNGRLGLTVGESQAFNGLVTGAVAIGKSDTGAEFRARMQFADVDLDTCMAELFGIRKIEGKGTLQFDLEASGPNVLALTRSLNGNAGLSSQRGALTGMNVEQLLRRLERRPLSGGGDFRNGRTPYDRLAVAVRITQGVATVEEGRLDGTNVRLALLGSASIPARDLDLKGTASLLDSPTEKTAAFDLPFVVQGPWDDPLMLPDPQILIRRSGAAAPLLDAMRDRKTLDTVRSAIDRLTGSGIRPAGGEPAPAEAPAAAEPSTR